MNKKEWAAAYIMEFGTNLLVPTWGERRHEFLQSMAKELGLKRTYTGSMSNPDTLDVLAREIHKCSWHAWIDTRKH